MSACDNISAIRLLALGNWKQTFIEHRSFEVSGRDVGQS